MKKKLIRITTVPASLGGLLDGQLKFMSEFYEVIGVSSPGKEDQLGDIGVKEGIRVIPIEMTRKITPFRDLRATWKLYKFFKREKPFIVHTHTPKAGTLGMFAAYLASVPNRLHTVAGLPLLVVTGKKRFLLDMVEKMTYACATNIYPNSQGLKDIIIINKYAKAHKLKVLGNGSSNGINTDYFNPSLFAENNKQALKNLLGIKNKDFVFIFVGRIVKDKGINELIQAFELIRKENSLAKLLLVGSFERNLDPLENKTETIIKSSDAIIHVGWQDDVRPYFAISDVLVFPSYREGFPNVVMQAGAMGLMSIVSDINGCNEIIVNGENGIIIPPKNVKALTEQMTLILNRPIDQNKRDYCRQFIKERYEQLSVWRSILEEYKQLENEEHFN